MAWAQQRTSAAYPVSAMSAPRRSEFRMRNIEIRIMRIFRALSCHSYHLGRTRQRTSHFHTPSALA